MASSKSSRIGQKSHAPRSIPTSDVKAAKRDVTTLPLQKPKRRPGKHLDHVITIPVNLDNTSDMSSGGNTCRSSSSKVSSSSSEDEVQSIRSGDDSSHDDTLGVRHEKALDPKPRIDTCKVTLPRHPELTLPQGSERYDPVQATWPGSLAYAGSFMAARLAQFALTAVGNTQGAALAFATLAGVLHIGVEPLVGALRDKMGMRGDMDTASYTNYVTSLTDYVECTLRGDHEGASKARLVARNLLAQYGFDCAYVATRSPDLQPPMPSIWREATTMLAAGARGIVSNELPFFSFATVYMLTNPMGLWTRSALLEYTGSEQLAKASELLLSLAGGILSGAATVGLQNVARHQIQSISHAPARRAIQLEQLNWRNREFTQVALKTFKSAIEDALDTLDATEQANVDRGAIEDLLIDQLYLVSLQPHQAESVIQKLSAELQALPRHELSSLLAEVKQAVRLAKKPYTFPSAVADKYQQMVATKDTEGVYHPDSGKVRRLVARTAGNVAGLMVYSMALVQAIDTVAHYAPASLPVQGNGTHPDTRHASPEEAYGQMASLGWTLISCWVAGRALVPPLADLVLAPVTSGMKGLAHLGQSMWQSLRDDAPADPAPSGVIIV